MSRTRLNIFLEREHAQRLDELACMKHLSKSSIVAAALASYLSPEGADRREATTAKRLDRVHHLFERLERDQSILIETLALFIRHHFAIAPMVPDSQHEAARAQGRVRFEQFIEQLARHLQRGNSFVKEVFEEITSEGTQSGGVTDNSAEVQP